MLKADIKVGMLVYSNFKELFNLAEVIEFAECPCCVMCWFPRYQQYDSRPIIDLSPFNKEKENVQGTQV